MELVQKAMDFAYRRHFGQKRKENLIPYFLHPCSVMSRLHKLGISDEIILGAALLHDVVEDCGVTILELRGSFGEEVAAIANELTRYPTDDKTKYLESFATKSAEALLIKVADRLDNVEDFNVTNYVYARKYFKKAGPIWQAFEQRGNEFDKRIFFHLMDDIKGWYIEVVNGGF